MRIEIRQIRSQDKDQWLPLWRAYQAFYEADLSADEDRLWRALNAPQKDGPYGLVAAGGDGELLGIAHYLFHITTWSSAPRCYLNDLFTLPQARGQGVGRKLVEAVYAKSDEHGAGQVWWLTQEFNREARLLYDRIAKVTPFIKYAR